MDYIVEKDRCTGCKMCGDLCPDQAITFRVDREGFWTPEIDQDKCSSCGLCRRECPAGNPFVKEGNTEPAVYAAWLKDTDMRLNSTSGGAYYGFAKRVLDDGGVVAACRFTGDWKHAEHIIAQDDPSLMQTIRSKYFQSNTEGIYRSVKDYLGRGKTVLFCGTPCHSAALQRFLGQKKENLITMDFICRGINSQKAFEAFITELEQKYDSKVVNVHAKNKRKGWTSLGILIQFENGQEYYETRSNSYWSLGYIRDNLYMRPSCHQCLYRNIPRISDFTIGDFWGIQGADAEDIFKGISVLFANNEKAENRLEEMHDSMHLERKPLQEAIKGNPCLLTSPAEGSKRGQFFELLEAMSFSQAVLECCGKLGC